jgi:hypothetical protein
MLQIVLKSSTGNPRLADEKALGNRYGPTIFPIKSEKPNASIFIIGSNREAKG